MIKLSYVFYIAEMREKYMKKQVIIIVCVVAAVALLIVGYLIFQKHKNQQNKNGGSGESSDVVFQLPEGFEWEGSYVDAVSGYAVLTIERSKDLYLCSVAVPTSDISYVNTYTFEAVKSKDGNSLVYTGGIHTEYLIPDLDSDAEMTTTEIYTDGTGEIYYYNGYIFWIDDKDSAGREFLFTPQDLNDLGAAS